MLDLAFLVLLIYIMYKANHGEVNDTLCNVATVIGVLAGVTGLIVVFFEEDSGVWWLHIVVMLMAFFLKRWAKKFAELYNNKIKENLEREAKYHKMETHHTRGDEYNAVYDDTNFDDPNIRFGGGSGKNWN